MINYIIRRLLILPVIMLGLSLLIFGMLQMLDPAERAVLYVSGPPRTQRALQDIIEKYGLDKPIYVQYVNWLDQVVHGNLGWSRTANEPVADALKQYFPATIELALWSFLPIMIGGIWLGVQAAVKHDTVTDQAARIFSIIGYSFPTFVFGLLMLLLFYARLQWLPPGRLSDWATAVVFSPGFHRYTNMYSIDALLNLRLDVFWDSVKHLILPVITLAYVEWALVLRVTRSSMLEVIGQEYVTVARAKGLSYKDVIRRHARPNAMIPVATIGGLLLVGLLNGAVITETVFNYHGMGWWAANAALNFDAVSILGIALFNGFLLIMANLVVDVLYAYLDPRIRLS
jgi:peptide/nickel transport system permease protein